MRVDAVEPPRTAAPTRASREHFEQTPPLLKLLLRSNLVPFMAQRQIRVGDGFSLNPRLLSVPFISSGYAAVATPAGVEFPKALCNGGEFSFVDGPIVNKISGLRGSSMPASATYTAPNYNYGYPNGVTTRAKTATVTAFIDDKWYQSSFKLAICTTDC